MYVLPSFPPKKQVHIALVLELRGLSWSTLPGVDSPLETYLMCVGFYELKLPYIWKF